MRVLLIDDDIDLCVLLKDLLERQGFSVAYEHAGARGLARGLSGEADLVVLDLMLPDMDGLTVLRRLRARSSMPVIILTAKGEERDRIDGLEAGADDYLGKPFNPRELLARIRSVSRRLRGPSRTRLEVNGVVIDPGAREVTCDGERIAITSLEFDVLQVLVNSAGRVVSRDELMERLYNRKATPFDRSIDMHVSHLRKKLEIRRPLIKTVRGVGYQFCESSKSTKEPS